MVGIFLTRTIPRGLSADATADAIHAQGGLVSIPHPYDPFRARISARRPLIALAEAGKIDMVEVFNSRVTFQRHNQEAADFAARYGIPGIAASDSHSRFEIAMSFNVLPAFDDAAEPEGAAARQRLARSAFHRPHPRHHPLGGVAEHVRRLARQAAPPPARSWARSDPRRWRRSRSSRPAPAELPEPNDPEAQERG